MNATDTLLPKTNATPSLPTTAQELEDLQHKLGEVLRKYDRVEIERGEKLAEIELPFNQEMARLQKEAERIANVIYEYATRNRSLLTNNDRKKTVKHAGGSFNWRKKIAVVYAEDRIKELIAVLKRRKLKRLVRIKEDVDRTAIRKERELIERRMIPHITFIDTEIFSIEPVGTRGMTRYADVDTNVDGWKIDKPEKENDSESESE